MANIKTPNPGFAGAYRDAAELTPHPNRSTFKAICKVCNKRWFEGNYWRFQCDQCNPELLKQSRQREYDKLRKQRAQRAARKRAKEAALDI